MVKGANQRLKFIPETEQAAGIEPLTFRFRIKSVGPAAVSTVRTQSPDGGNFSSVRTQSPDRGIRQDSESRQSPDRVLTSGLYQDSES